MASASVLLVSLGLCCITSLANPQGKLSQAHYGAGDHNYRYDREALLGGEEEVEEFSKFKLEEAEKKLKLLVKKIDKDDNGLLSKDELSLWILGSFRHFATQEARERFPQVDRDGDQVVTLQEYVNHKYLNHRFGTQSGDEDDNEQLKAFQELYVDRKRFEKADADGVEGLNRTEFMAYEHPEETEYMLDYVVDEALLKFDSDGDGSVILSEFVGDHQLYPGKLNVLEEVIFEKESLAHYLDKDHDGKLNRQELRPWLIPNNMESAGDEASHLLEHMDIDRDGFLSEAEVLGNRNVLFRSEVTGYGRLIGDAHGPHEDL